MLRYNIIISFSTYVLTLTPQYQHQHLGTDSEQMISWGGGGGGRETPTSRDTNTGVCNISATIQSLVTLRLSVIKTSSVYLNLKSVKPRQLIGKTRQAKHISLRAHINRRRSRDREQTIPGNEELSLQYGIVKGRLA